MEATNISNQDRMEEMARANKTAAVVNEECPIATSHTTKRVPAELAAKRDLISTRREAKVKYKKLIDDYRVIKTQLLENVKKKKIVRPIMRQIYKAKTASDIRTLMEKF